MDRENPSPNGIEVGTWKVAYIFFLKFTFTRTPVLTESGTEISATWIYCLT